MNQRRCWIFWTTLIFVVALLFYKLCHHILLHSRRELTTKAHYQTL